MSAQVISEKILSPKENATAREVLTESVGDVRDKALGFIERTKARAVQFENEFEDRVRAHPLRSVAIAAGIGVGVGFLIGFLVGRR